MPDSFRFRNAFYPMNKQILNVFIISVFVQSQKIPGMPYLHPDCIFILVMVINQYESVNFGEVLDMFRENFYGTKI